MNLTKFLLARIAEDEAVARAAGSAVWSPGKDGSVDEREVTKRTADAPDESVVYDEGIGVPTRGERDHIATWNPARVLVECEGKRRITNVVPLSTGAKVMHRKVLGLLALPYADHPEYQQEWEC